MLEREIINLIQANQTAIKELGRELQELKASQERDRKDQWKMISELTDGLKEAQVTITAFLKRIEKLEEK